MKIRSYAKVNIFLKIVGKKDGFHLLNSRFMLVKSFFDTISFEKKSFPSDEFILEGDFGCQTKSNTIYKVYKELSSYPNVKEFFRSYKVVVDKRIPEFAGLGGGSSNCAAFLNLCDEVCSLKLTLDQKIQIGKKIGSDVAFFIYGYDSANVFGFGEIVERFDEEALDIDTFTPPIKCSTPEVYKRYSSNFLNFDREFAKTLLKKRSDEILKNYSIKELNDLYLPALSLYPNIKEYVEPHHFFSGSGSTLFWIKK